MDFPPRTGDLVIFGASSHDPFPLLILHVSPVHTDLRVGAPAVVLEFLLDTGEIFKDTWSWHQVVQHLTLIGRQPTI